MATRTASTGSTAGRLITALSTPRPVIRFFLALLLGAIGLALHELVQAKVVSAQLVTYLAGLAGPFALLCLTAIWSMREKIDSALDGEYVDASEFRQQREVAAKLRTRVMRRAAWVALAALAAAGPAIAKSVDLQTSGWMLALAGVGVAEAIYGYMLADRWETELRAMKDRKMLARKRREEQDELVARIVGDGKPAAGQPIGKGGSLVQH